MPPLALISSTAISIESFAPWPHSAPLPVRETRQPILTLRPSTLAAPSCVFSCRMRGEVGALHFGHVQQLLARSAQNDPAAFHDVAPVGNLQRLPGVLLDQQNRLAFLFEFAER